MSSPGSPWPAPLELLPHGAAACHIDRIIEFDPGRRVRAAWTVRDDSILYDGTRGGVPAWAGLELMAQCAGLYLGLSRASDAAAPDAGYLVGVRRADLVHPLFPAGSELLIDARCEAAGAAAGEMGLFDCRILCAGTAYLKARLLLWCGQGYT